MRSSIYHCAAARAYFPTTTSCLGECRRVKTDSVAGTKLCCPVYPKLPILLVPRSTVMLMREAARIGRGWRFLYHTQTVALSCAPSDMFGICWCTPRAAAIRQIVVDCITCCGAARSQCFNAVTCGRCSGCENSSNAPPQPAVACTKFEWRAACNMLRAYACSLTLS